MIRYVALLRGINVGGHKKIKMADLRQMFAGAGFSNIKTVLASGNVAFDSNDQDNIPALTSKIETLIETGAGFTVPVIVLPQHRINLLVESDPFANIDITQQTRLYVTFLPEPITPSIPIPYTASDGDFKILRATGTHVCSVLNVTKTRSVDGMAILEREFGKFITTRNWNTVRKIASL